MTPEEKANKKAKKIDIGAACKCSESYICARHRQIVFALLSMRKEALDAAINEVEDAGGDNTEYHVAAIRNLEDL